MMQKTNNGWLYSWEEFYAADRFEQMLQMLIKLKAAVVQKEGNATVLLKKEWVE